MNATSNVEEVLKLTGMVCHTPSDYSAREVVLRGGELATLWVHGPTGHGILDPMYWEHAGYYEERYREEFNACLQRDSGPEENLSIFRELNSRQFDLFKDKLTSDSRYLEIGCSHGGVLQYVLQHGVSECVVVEPCRRDAQYLKQQYGAAASILNHLLHDAELEPDYFSMAVSFEVLEHVSNPLYFLEKIHRSLQKGGDICLEVPNHNDLLLSCYNAPAYREFYYHKAHIHYFTPESLLEIAQYCGFEGKVASFLMYPMTNNMWWALNNRPQGDCNISLADFVPCHTQSKAAQKINDFWIHMAKEYEVLVNQLMVGDCLVFSGQKS